MKTQNQVRITNENVRITADNVQHIGECIALSAIKKMMRFAHHAFCRFVSKLVMILR